MQVLTDIYKLEKVRSKDNYNKIIALAKKGHYTKEIASILMLPYSYVRDVLSANNMYTNIHKQRKEKRIKHNLPKAEKLARQLGRIPTYTELYKLLKVHNPKLALTCRKHLKKLGFKDMTSNNDSWQKFSNEHLLDHLKKLAKKLGKTPSGRDLAEDGKVSIFIYQDRFGGYIKAQKKAGLIPNRDYKTRNRKKYSEEYLLDLLRALAKKLGRTPSGRDIENAGIVSRTIYHDRFGSLAKAQKAAGQVPSLGKKLLKYSDEYLMDHLKKLAKKLGRTPDWNDLIKAGHGSPTLYRMRFGSISKAQKKAGLVPIEYKNRQKYSDEYLLNHLSELAKELGRTPIWCDIAKAGKGSPTLFKMRFGSILNAQKKAGLAPAQRKSFQKYSNQYLIDQLQKLAKQLGRTPSLSDMDYVHIASWGVFNKQFGSFVKAQEAAGLVPNVFGQINKYSDEYLLDLLRELAKQLNRTPAGHDINKSGKVSLNLFTKRFGNLGKAQKAAGLVPSVKGKLNKYSDEYLLDYLRELAKQLNRTPTGHDIKKSGKIGMGLYIRRFGNLGKAQKAAGLVPTNVGRVKK
jgi:uncharacterized protein YihD (DUF1040 family)/uncharacterized protein YejL (UPF0352 family)